LSVYPFMLHLHDAYMERFLMLSVITNIYNNKNKGHTLMELFIATGKLNYFTTKDVRCVHHGWHIEHLYLSKKNFFSFLWLWTIPLR
jgi:hypothetical protein